MSVTQRVAREGLELDCFAIGAKLTIPCPDAVQIRFGGSPQGPETKSRKQPHAK